MASLSEKKKWDIALFCRRLTYWYYCSYRLPHVSVGANPPCQYRLFAAMCALCIPLPLPTLPPAKIFNFSDPAQLEQATILRDCEVPFKLFGEHAKKTAAAHSQRAKRNALSATRTVVVHLSPCLSVPLKTRLGVGQGGGV